MYMYMYIFSVVESCADTRNDCKEQADINRCNTYPETAIRDCPFSCGACS